MFNFLVRGYFLLEMTFKRQMLRFIKRLKEKNIETFFSLKDIGVRTQFS